jgi:hypothetical protein
MPQNLCSILIFQKDTGRFYRCEGLPVSMSMLSHDRWRGFHTKHYIYGDSDNAQLCNRVRTDAEEPKPYKAGGKVSVNLSNPRAAWNVSARFRIA